MADRFMVVKKGYDTSEVDAYIDTLEQIVQSYKEKDNAIKNAIISAQIAADNIIRNAHLQVSETRSKTLSQVNHITSSISAQRNKVKDFQDEYNRLIRKYLTEFNDDDINSIYEKIGELEQYTAKLGYQATMIQTQEQDQDQDQARDAGNEGAQENPNPENGADGF